MATTVNRGYPLPDATHLVSDDIAVLISAYQSIDADVQAAWDKIADKVESDQAWPISSVTGLQAALDDKMAATKTFALADLTDTSGVAGAGTGYLLQLQANGKWTPVSVTAAIGTVTVDIAHVTGLSDDLASLEMPAQINAATETALADADESGWRQATSGNLIKRSWANVKAALQTAFDARYTQPGQFGWGAAAGAGTPSMVIPSGDYNQAVVAGVYTGPGASAVNGPPGDGAYGPLLVLRRIQTTIVQITVFGSPTQPAELYTRASSDGGSTWGSWATVYNDQKHGQQLLPMPSTTGDSVDLNTLTTPGWSPYLMKGTSPNGWSGTNYCYVLTLVYNTNITQMAFGYGSGGSQTACWIRQRYNGTWSSWSEIYTSGSGVPWAAVTGAPNFGVPSSSTMPVGWSGDCTVTSSSVSSGASTAGSNLKPVGSSVSQSGTWLNLSAATIAASGVGLFVRTA